VRECLFEFSAERGEVLVAVFFGRFEVVGCLGEFGSTPFEVVCLVGEFGDAGCAGVFGHGAVFEGDCASELERLADYYDATLKSAVA